MAHLVSGSAGSRKRSRGLCVRGRFLLATFAVLALSSARAFASGPNVQITGLSDVNFGTISNLAADAVRAQSVCVFSGSGTSGYRITATGSGSSNSFALSASGGRRLAYDVQWSQQSGQTAGTQLTTGVALTGLISTATQATCSSGPATTASLIVIARAAVLSSATAASYSGTLTLLIGPE